MHGCARWREGSWGVALPVQMVERARALGLYDELVGAELLACYQEDAQTRARDAASPQTCLSTSAAPLRAATRDPRPGGLVVSRPNAADDALGQLPSRPGGSATPGAHVARAARAGFKHLEPSDVSYRGEAGGVGGSPIVRLWIGP